MESQPPSTLGLKMKKELPFIELTLTKCSKVIITTTFVTHQHLPTPPPKKKKIFPRKKQLVDSLFHSFVIQLNINEIKCALLLKSYIDNI